jgi:hypothetical protein
LLQIAVERVCYVFDALRLADLSPLQAVFDNPYGVTLLHGAGADIRVLAERGLVISHYYDLEAASRSIFGQQESSLAAMMQRAFGVRLDKSLQRTDWTRRPLPPAMIAYAARDAEVTLALYDWLYRYYPAILAQHEYTASDNQFEGIASWVATFLRGNSQLSADQVVSDAKAQGLVLNKPQMATAVHAALQVPMHPQQRGRLLRLIADLGLTQLMPDLFPFLYAATSDERVASVRALSRLAIQSNAEQITPLLDDPVFDVRKATYLALRSLGDKDTRPPRATPATAADGTRTWTIADNESDAQSNDDDQGWRARLRSMMND